MQNHLKPTPLIHALGSPIYYQGPDLSLGPLPAVIYFALSGASSLYEDPFNQPVVALTQEPIRVFSWDLPFHGEHFDPKEAMKAWAQEFTYNPNFVSNFIEVCKQNIDYLIQQNLIKPHYLAIAGLSRGSFVATHWAAYDHRLRYILGFAPLTKPRPIEEFTHLSPTLYESIDLTALVEHLIHKPIRFYIGNHDTRVGTASCFEFIKALVDTSFAKGIRSPPAELIIYPAIGYKGHGTPPHIFHDGVNWLKTHLLK